MDPTTVTSLNFKLPSRPSWLIYDVQVYYGHPPHVTVKNH